MAKPQIQHWVPQFYLRRFSTVESRNSSTPQVWVWNKTSRKPLPAPTAVKNLCGQRYLYTPEDENGERSWATESALERIEAKAGEVWSSLLNGKARLSEEGTRRLVAEFVATLHLRNVAILTTVDRIMSLRDQLYGAPSSEFLASRTDADPDPTHPGRYFIHLLRNKERIVQALANKRWTVLCTDHEVLITSDRPVVFTHQSKRGGPGQPDSVVYFPIGPDRLLLMDGDTTGPHDVYAKLDDNKGPSVNAISQEAALRFLFASKPVSELLLQ